MPSNWIVMMRWPKNGGWKRRKTSVRWLIRSLCRGILIFRLMAAITSCREALKVVDSAKFDIQGTKCMIKMEVSSATTKRLRNRFCWLADSWIKNSRRRPNFCYSFPLRIFRNGHENRLMTKFLHAVIVGAAVSSQFIVIPSRTM